jgi:thiol:disulfide interchange protein DsbD
MRRALAFLAAAWAAAVLAAPSSADEPLEADVAFRPSGAFVFEPAREPGGAGRHGIDIEYRIAPGYYLYRSRLGFQVVPATAVVGPPEIPPGQEMDDPFLGKSAIFRDRVTIHLPFATSVVPPGHYVVKIVAQGCAEDRLCYSPFRQEVAVTVPPGYRSPPARPPAIPGLPR